MFARKWSKVYNGADNQVTVKWDDPNLNLNWKVKNPILSKRDSEHSVLSQGIYL